MREALAIWALLALDAFLILVTYARLPPEELYRTSIGGLPGGLGRALVELNFPLALIAIGLLGIAADALFDSCGRLVIVVTVVAVPMCALSAVLVDQHDLDAALGNVVPAVGLALIAMLTVVAVRQVGLEPTPPAAGDPVRIAVTALLALGAIPWVFALLGFYAPDPFLADEPSPGEPLPAVHLGGHHGFYGVLFAVAGLTLSRALPSFRHPWVVAVTSPVLALALAYGFANALQDFTLEQLWKRGTIAWKPPSVLLPAASWGWLAILLATVAIEVLWFRRERR